MRLFSELNSNQRILFYSMVRDAVADGIPIYEVIKDIRAGNSLLKIFPPSVLDNILLSMRGHGGNAPKTFGESVRNYCDPVEAILLSSSEKSAKLVTGLDEAIGLLRASGRIRGTLFSAYSYPVLLLALLAVFMTVVSSKMIPVMQDILPRAKWGAEGQIIGVIADNATFILSSLYGSLALFAFSFMATVRGWTGPIRRNMDHYVPPWSIYRTIQSSMVLTTMAMMLESGIPTSAALAQIHRIGSPWMQSYIEPMQNRMRKGKPDAESITGGGGVGTLFDMKLAWEISMYGKRTNFAKTLKSLSDRAILLVENRIKAQSAVIRTLLLFVVAGLLAGTMFSFFQVVMQARGQ